MTAHLPSCFIDVLHTRFAQANKTLVAVARSGAHARWSDRVRIVPSHIVLNPPRIAANHTSAAERLAQRHPDRDRLPVAAGFSTHAAHSVPQGTLAARFVAVPDCSSKGRRRDRLHFAVQRFSTIRLRELEP